MVVSTREVSMPLVFYMPYIVWSGMIEFMLDRTHDPDGQDARRNVADLIIDAPSVIPFPAAAIR
jgi:hypothetical protein